MNYFYGPVPSRRLGLSLGVNLFPGKKCNFDCVYCQLGSFGAHCLRRFWLADLRDLKRQLKNIMKDPPAIDYITISGSGEPTLHKRLDLIISAIKGLTRGRYPVCVITNSSLLYRKDVRKELAQADLVVPSLDAAAPAVLRRLNRPGPGIELKKIIEGIKKFKAGFGGSIWIEVMLVKGLNDSISHIRRLKKIIDDIGPDRIQLNIPVRPGAVGGIIPQAAVVDNIRKILGENAEVVSEFKDNSAKKSGQKGGVSLCLRKDIIRYIRSRPGTISDLSAALSADKSHILKELEILTGKGQVEKCRKGKKGYYRYADKGKRRVSS